MIERRDWLIAAVLCVLVTAVTAAASTRQGLTRDEAYYMKAGERYIRYYEDALTGRLKDPLSDAAIQPYWSYNTEHPSLSKTLYGLSWRVLHRCTCAADSQWHPEVSRITSGRHTTLSLLSEITAFRLPTAIAFGLLCAVVYLFFIEALGSRWGGVAAALLAVAQPRAFFHAQTASFDLPIAALWVMTTYAYWRSIGATAAGDEARTDVRRRNSWWSAILTGFLFGLCLATKLQSFLLPVALTLHCAWLLARRKYEAAYGAVKSLLMMAILGPVMMVALWPWLWHDTIARIGGYLRFHLGHEHYNFEYLGRNFNQPPFPWHEPLGMLLFTAPVVLLVLAAAGIALLARPSAPLPRDDRSTRALLLFAGVVPVAIFMSGTTPIYGETKHWLATMPFLAMAAGYALDRLRAAVMSEMRIDGRSWRGTAVPAALVAIAFVPAAVEVVHSHPYGLSQYNALAGGPPGGADLGMNRQFWGYSVKGLLPWLNANVRSGARLYPHDWNHDSWDLYLRDRQLRTDIVETGGVRGSDVAIVIHEKHFNEFDYQIWEEFGHVQPAEVLTLDGVPLVSVYLKNPRGQGTGDRGTRGLGDSGTRALHFNRSTDRR